MPTQPNTAAQTAIRTAVGAASTAWGATLTDAQRTAWKDFADSYPITDRLGQPLTLTGQQAFVKLNTRLINAGRAQLTEAPTDQNVTDVTSIAVSIDVNGSVFTVTPTPNTIGANDILIVRASPSFSAGKSYFTNLLRDTAFSGGGLAVPFDISALWVAKFGAFPLEGTKVGVSVNCLRTTNGAYDAELRATTTVVDTTP